MSAWTRALGRNETLFREINDYIADMSRALPPEDQFEVLCECDSLGCAQTIALTAREYVAIRRNDGRFIVVRSHEEAGLDRVVSEAGSYLVVERATGA
jgi:hypothetical protein